MYDSLYDLVKIKLIIYIMKPYVKTKVVSIIHQSFAYCDTEARASPVIHSLVGLTW